MEYEMDFNYSIKVIVMSMNISFNASGSSQLYRN